MDEESSNSGFRVVDKRRFDESGEERSESGDAGAQPERQSTADPGLGEKTQEVRQEDLEQSGSAQVDFPSFIVSLATQCLMLLGEIPNPESKLLAANFEAARQTIDIIAMLEEKTRGNLSPEECSLMEEVLSSLRLAYVKKIKAG